MKFYSLITFFVFLISAEISLAQDNSIGDRREIPKLKTESLQVEMDVDLFPNPAEDFLNITIKNSSLKNVQIEMYNVIGNKLDLDLDKSSSDTYKVNVKEFHSGYYLLIVKDPISRFNKAYKFRKR